MRQNEAAEAIAIQATVFARRTGQPITMMAIWETLSECGGGHKGAYLKQAAEQANVKTIKRKIRQSLRMTDQPELIQF